MRFKVGDRVESLHNRIEPTGHYGVVVAVEHKPGSGGCMVTVREDNMGDDRFQMWEHEDYFRLTPNVELTGARPTTSAEGTTAESPATLQSPQSGRPG